MILKNRIFRSDRPVEAAINHFMGFIDRADVLKVNAFH